MRTIFAQPDAESVKAQHARTVEQLHQRFPAAAKMLAEAEEDRVLGAGERCSPALSVDVNTRPRTL